MSLEVVTVGNATLYRADCMDVLPTLPRFDLLLTDPPYGVAHDKSGATKRYKVRDTIDGDLTPPDVAWMASHRSIIWGGNNFGLPRSTGWLVWDKCHPEGSQHSQAELAWTNVVRTIRHYREAYHGFMRQRDGWFHPTQKPVGLMKWCIGFTDADCIFDAYMGSGTVGIACAQMGKRFIGVEIHKPYFDIACKRIEDAQRITDMFGFNGTTAADLATQEALL